MRRERQAAKNLHDSLLDQLEWQTTIANKYNLPASHFNPTPSELTHEMTLYFRDAFLDLYKQWDSLNASEMRQLLKSEWWIAKLVAETKAKQQRQVIKKLR